MATGTDDSRTCAVAECDKGPILQTDGRVDARAFAVPRNERSGLITLVFLTLQIIGHVHEAILRLRYISDYS